MADTKFTVANRKVIPQMYFSVEYKCDPACTFLYNGKSNTEFLFSTYYVPGSGTDSVFKMGFILALL